MNVLHPKQISLSFCVSLIALLGVLAFGPTLKSGFIWDDHEMIVKNSTIKTISVSSIKHIFAHDVFDGRGDAYYRPIQSLSYMIEYKIWGLRPFGFHLTNLLFHVANAILLLFLIAHLFQNFQLGLLSSALFVVHPIIVEQLLIVAGRAEVMSTFFMFAGLVWIVRSPNRVVGPPVLFALSLLSKESGLIMPFLLALGLLVDRKIKIRWLLVLGFVVVSAGYFLLRSAVLPIHLQPAPIASVLQSLVTDVPAALLEYVRISALPIDLHSHRRMMFSNTHYLIAIIFWTVLMAIAFFKRSRIGLFFLGWFLLGFAVKVPLLATNSLMLDHWAYVSVAGFSAFFAYVVHNSSDSRAWANKLLFMVFGGALCFWMGLSLFYSQARGSDEKMYTWALRFPTSSVVRGNLGVLYYQRGEFQNAKPLLEESLAMNFNSGTANVLALTEWKLGQSERAMEILGRLVIQNPSDLQSQANLALVEGGRKGLSRVDQILIQQPNRISALLLKADLQLSLNEPSSALETFKKILQIDPVNPAALKALESSAHLLQDPQGLTPAGLRQEKER